MVIPAKSFLNALVIDGAITQEEAQHYEIESLQKNIPIDEYLLTISKIKKESILKAKAQILKVDYIDVNTSPIAPQALNLIPESIASKYVLIPVELDDNKNTLKVVMENPFDVQVKEFLEKKTSKRIITTLGLADDITRAIDIFYTKTFSPDIVAALKEVEPAIKTVRVENLGELIKEAPIAKIVSTILEFAVKGRASDVHIEPQENRTKIRYRIDGILQEKLTLPKLIHESLISRIKILSGLKIDEKRIPQDGRFNFKIGAEEVDLRVSTLPTINGEKVVMRLLKKTGGLPSLYDLGLRGPQLKVLEEAIEKPYGIILVTGPTGSGKSTTLYSVLSKLNKPSVNILTLEDPVEYQILGINQVQINPQSGLTFATGLRSFLRQDPNIILVGEIRDKETTQLAIQAALTGHLVFSTLHTNDASTAIPRLVDLGAEPFLIASVLNAVIGQRITRTLCQYCKLSFSPSQEALANISTVLQNFLPKKIQENPQSVKIFKAVGCEECNHMGYLGRIGIFEVLKVTPEITKLIISHPSADEIEKQAKKESLITMIQDGYLKVLEGITTIEEVLRVAEI
ncbi:hypothetical protein A3C23_03480 [Candidatus Roizmanbacteria bacterium RIFCSPHIGHO2_02_FULL_37_13b]|uniref:AAA+ ATPase domain-containing protein n=1 Tax=Candidatus Roizmanbacteria bacterium RIFCSPLOWO2_02_FULL_36_11 TaxID=1802071 RepID=A0A1F7JC29_9BACT|nr:MAG: hypothetical protein A3C23_03480 [Candidatus Roizmanbacteria bacterium RIFCSPHIGHO2_02_FULL_37_13b]OGK53152.1 MAG: hypothetical protein A3H78_02095 [Candidatus Roizmanbacteria bacterium RIFCSPLOWO2_02_FULL_36_11]